jgi:hypothetical protein
MNEIHELVGVKLHRSAYDQRTSLYCIVSHEQERECDVADGKTKEP